MRSLLVVVAMIGASTGQGHGASLDKTSLKRVINRQFGEIRACYEKARAADASLQGKVIVDFAIEATGAVSAATADGLTPSMAACVAGVFQRMRFAARTGAAVKIRYPLVFQPPGAS